MIDLNKISSELRCNAFINHFSTEEFKPRDFWRTLSIFWSSFDIIDHEAIQQLMYEVPYRHAFLENKCKKKIEALTDDQEIVIYRGQNDGPCGNDNVTGLSWSTSFDVAEKFARSGIRGYTAGTPYVLQSSVYKREIAMMLDDRGEHEVVLFDMENSIHATHRLTS